MKNKKLIGLIVIGQVFLFGFDSHAETLATEPKQPTKNIKANVDDSAELQAPLDLSVPFDAAKETNAPNHSTEPNGKAESAVDDLFAPKPKKPDQPLQLKGGFLMSPEPEVEKKKTVDGAGIVIDLKP